MTSVTINADFKLLTPIDLYNKCNAMNIDSRPPECEDYNYFLPKFELKLFNVDPSTNIATPILDKTNIEITLKLLDLNNQIIENVTMPRFESNDNNRPFVYEIVSNTIEGSTVNGVHIPTLQFSISNSGSVPVNKYELHIFRNDINEAAMHIINNPVVEFGVKDMAKRNMTADITITAGTNKYDATNQIEKITIIDDNNNEYSTTSTNGITFEKGVDKKVTLFFENMNVGKTFRKIKVKVGKKNGIGLVRIQGSFKNDDGSEYASFNKTVTNKWIKNGSHTFDIGKSITIPSAQETDYNNITLKFSVTDKQLSGAESFTVYGFGKQNMNNDLKNILQGTNIESFSNKLNYSNYSVMEGFDGSVINTANSDELKQIHNNIIVQQAELDKNIAELKKDKNSIYMENQRRYDRTMFGGIVTTILASSLVYYMFTDM
jgi:type VI protein secretion system component Hcp